MLWAASCLVRENLHRSHIVVFHRHKPYLSDTRENARTPTPFEVRGWTLVVRMVLVGSTVVASVVLLVAHRALETVMPMPLGSMEVSSEEEVTLLVSLVLFHRLMVGVKCMEVTLVAAVDSTLVGMLPNSAKEIIRLSSITMVREVVICFSIREVPSTMVLVSSQLMEGQVVASSLQVGHRHIHRVCSQGVTPWCLAEVLPPIRATVVQLLIMARVDSVNMEGAEDLEVVFRVQGVDMDLICLLLGGEEDNSYGVQWLLVQLQTRR